MQRACLLAVIAGYADTVGFLQFDAFAGLMTGNTVLLGISLANADFERALHFAAIIGAFFLGVLCSRVVLRCYLPPTFCLVVAALSIVASTFTPVAASALILAFAMGCQNAAATRFGRVVLNTVFITGNLQKLGEGLVELLWPGRGDEARPPPRDVAIFGLVWFGYGVGAVIGALGHNWLRWPLLVPAAILPFVFVQGLGPLGNHVRKRRDSAASTHQIPMS
jgi:uncharacterized membrane protein YoaK (UPF0700 family)